MGSVCQRQYDQRRALTNDAELDFAQIQLQRDAAAARFPDDPHSRMMARDAGLGEDRGCCGDGRCCLMLTMVSCVVFLVACGGLILAPSIQGIVHRSQGGSISSAPGQSSVQPTRLRVTNGCNHEALWLARLGKDQVAGQNVKIWPMESYDVPIPENTLGTTRFWPKWRCVKEGNSCAIGDSGGPDMTCDVEAGCSPPMDTKFEATFGAVGLPCNTTLKKYEGCDFVDVSVKDGFTVPFQLDIKGECKGDFPRNTDTVNQIVDCTKLTVDQCPSNEIIMGMNLDLRAVNPVWGAVSGCLSPCSQLTFPGWKDGAGASGNRYNRNGVGAEASPYCCPTLEACQGGEMARTQYAQAVHRMCPGINSYPYDHGMGVGTCPAGTKYEIVFYCPRAVVAPTPPAPAPPAR